ncbi:unnamed protein product [Pedinophyceae sp. YPF-701]|nr:unnamed protein product [Pedinophyceae sp. YPF-701]
MPASLGRRGAPQDARSWPRGVRALLRRVSDPTDVGCAWAVAGMVLIWEVLVTALIVWKVPYTEIDWKTYMDQIDIVHAGETDYTSIETGTGPLVYPAGHVHIFSWLRHLTGGSIPHGQVIFGGVYVLTQAIVMWCYVTAQLLPPWALPLLALSKRLHSIYVLRLFNDCWAMLFTHAAVALMLSRRHNAAIVVFSAAVSVKMGALLLAPGALAVVVQEGTADGLAVGSAAGVLLQVALAMRFLLAHPLQYLSRAFELGRVFLHVWTVNLKFLPEHVFVSRALHVFLLVLHIALLAAFFRYKWFQGTQGPAWCIQRMFSPRPRAAGEGDGGAAQRRHVLYVLCTCNVVGVACARSLHYQFYSWYFHSLPALLWMLPWLPAVGKVAVMGVVEWCWNVFPSTPTSSLVLTGVHAALIAALLATAPPRAATPKHKTV